MRKIRKAGHAHELHEVLEASARRSAASAWSIHVHLGNHRGPRAVDDEGRLVQRELADAADAVRGLERERGAGGDAIDIGGAARFPDQRFDVFHLALDRVRRGIAALAAAAPIVGEHGEMLREQRRKLRRRAERAVAERAVDQDQRRAAPRPLEGDRGAIFRNDFEHAHDAFSESVTSRRVAALPLCRTRTAGMGATCG